MKKNRLFLLLALLMAAALVLGACGDGDETDAPEVVVTDAPEPEVVVTEPPAPEVTEPPEPEVTEPPEPELGSAERPIKVFFVPSVNTDVIISGGQIMADALAEATGYTFEVVVPTSYAATIEEMCASPSDSMGFIPGLGYVLANELCGVDVAFKAVRYGFPVYWTQFILPRDSEVTTFEELDGLTWAYPDAGSTSGYMVPLVMFQEAGIEPGDTVEAGGHSAVSRAVYNGEADFGTNFYSVPLIPDNGPWWSYLEYLNGEVTDDMWDIMPDLVDSCDVDAESGRLYCSGWRVLDARANIREEAPDVIQKVRILVTSPPIPNDTLSFGPDFPTDVREAIIEALMAFAETDAWGESIGNQDFYDWSGIQTAADSEYDFVRAMVLAVGISLETIGE